MKDLLNTKIGDYYTHVVSAFKNLQSDKYSQQDIEKCIEICELGRKIFPNNISLTYTSGNCYVIKNNYYKAKPCFEMVVAKLPDDAMAQTILASCYLYTNPTMNAEVDRGYKIIQNAIAINPNSSATQLYYARYLQRYRQLAGAKEHYLKAKAIDPSIVDSNLEMLLK